MTEQNLNENHTQLFQDAIRIIEDVIKMFMISNSPHAKMIVIALQGISMLINYVYAEHVRK